MSHLSQIAVILNAETGYTITSFPADHIPEGCYLQPAPDKVADHPNLETDFFYLIVHGTSLTSLETHVTAFKNASSLRPGGYQFTTAGQPIFIEINKSHKQWTAEENISVLIIEGRWAL